MACVLIKKVTPTAQMPTRATDGSAGFDIYSVSRVTIAGGDRAMVPTGIIAAIPQGIYGRIAPRSSLAINHGLITSGGVIDNDYRGEIWVIILNTSDKEYTFERGDRVAQIVFEKYETPELVNAVELNDTKRGTGGFGSTGK
jgi:dUTP pyrophosphatase